MSLIKTTRPSATSGAAAAQFDILGEVVAYAPDGQTVDVKIVNQGTMRGKIARIGIESIEIKSNKPDARQPQIADFMKGKSPMPKTPVGGKIFFDSAKFKTGTSRDSKPEGVDYEMMARWPCYVRTKNATEIDGYLVLNRREFTQNDVTKTSYTATVMDFDDASVSTALSRDEMLAALFEKLQASHKAGGNMSAMILPLEVVNQQNGEAEVSGALFRSTFLVRDDEKSTAEAPVYRVPATVEELDKVLAEQSKKFCEGAFADDMAKAPFFLVSTGQTYSVSGFKPEAKKAIGSVINYAFGRGDNAGEVFGLPSKIVLAKLESGRDIVSSAYPMTSQTDKRSDPIDRFIAATGFPVTKRLAEMMGKPLTSMDAADAEVNHDLAKTDLEADASADGLFDETPAAAPAATVTRRRPGSF